MIYWLFIGCLSVIGLTNDHRFYNMSVFSVNSLKEFGKLLWSIEDERDKTVSDAVTLVIDFISTHHIAKHVLSRCQNVCPSI